MDAVEFFFDLLINFFPLLGSVILMGILLFVGVVVIWFCMMVLAVIISEMLG